MRPLTIRNFQIYILFSTAFLLTAAADFADAASFNKVNATQARGEMKTNFTRLDADGDGKLSRAEATNHKKLDKGFDNIDSNKDGFITADEIKSHKAKNSMRKLVVIDASKDGLISRDEADAKSPVIAKNFDKLDSNKDNLISRSELMAARASHRGRSNK